MCNPRKGSRRLHPSTPRQVQTRPTDRHPGPKSPRRGPNSTQLKSRPISKTRRGRQPGQALQQHQAARRSRPTADKHPGPPSAQKQHPQPKPAGPRPAPHHAHPEPGQPSSGVQGAKPPGVGSGARPRSNITALGEVPRRGTSSHTRLGGPGGEAPWHGVRGSAPEQHHGPRRSPPKGDEQPYPARGSRGRSPLAWGPGLGPGATSRPPAKSPKGTSMEGRLAPPPRLERGLEEPKSPVLPITPRRTAKTAEVYHRRIARRRIAWPLPHLLAGLAGAAHRVGRRAGRGAWSVRRLGAVDRSSVR